MWKRRLSVPRPGGKKDRRDNPITWDIGWGKSIKQILKQKRNRWRRFYVEACYGRTYLHEKVQQKVSIWHSHKDSKGSRNMSRDRSRQKIEATAYTGQRRGQRTTAVCTDSRAWLNAGAL